MTDSSEESKRRQRTKIIVKAYPFSLLVVVVIVNLFAFGVDPLVIALPSAESIRALVLAAVLLAINHTWLMTTTELTRVRYKMFSTPEEWTASGTRPEDAPAAGLRELERRHNAHRNTTENTIYFVLLALILVFVSPTAVAAQVWIIGFAVARLGYTFSYVAAKDSARGVFMSLSLMAMYGIASYLVMGLVG